MTDAHSQRQTFTVVESFPAHEPRTTDPHYHYFDAARRRLEKAGRLTCWINNGDCAGVIELHHDRVEYALANEVDISRFAHLYPEFSIESDEDFFRVIESEGCLTPLCVIHHRGVLGIHCVHYPAWVIQRYLKAGVTPPERKVLG